MFVWVCMWVYVCLHPYVCAYMCDLCLFICCVYVCVCLAMYVCVAHVCACVHAYVLVYVCVHSYMHMHIHTCRHWHAHLPHTHTHAQLKGVSELDVCLLGSGATDMLQFHCFLSAGSAAQVSLAAGQPEVNQLALQIQGMVVCFVWLVSFPDKYRVWWCALFGWLTRITNAGYGCVLCLVGQLPRKIQGMVVCFVWLISPCPTPQQIQAMVRCSLVGQLPLH